jgi:hypothetical protein
MELIKLVCNENPTYINAIATKMVVAISLVEKNADNTLVRMIIIMEVITPERASIILKLFFK